MSFIFRRNLPAFHFGRLPQALYMSPDDLILRESSPSRTAGKPAMTVVVASAHRSDGLYVAAAASLCEIDVIVADTVARTIEGLSNAERPLLFLDADLVEHENLIAWIRSGLSEPETVSLPIVSIISRHEAEDDQLLQITGKPPSGVSAVLLRPMPVAEIVRIIDYYKAAI
jgi:hypothetical protein